MSTTFDGKKDFTAEVKVCFTIELKFINSISYSINNIFRKLPMKLEILLKIKVLMKPFLFCYL